MDKYAQLEEKTNEYLIKAANDPRIPDNNVVNDLRARKKGNIITMIRNKGGITSSTIRYIADLDFLTKNYLPTIKRITAGLSIHINRLEERNGAVGYIATTSSNNTVFLPHYTFAEEFGEEIIQGKKSLHVCNAPSPAATASLEIGKEVVKQIGERSDNLVIV